MASKGRLTWRLTNQVITAGTLMALGIAAVAPSLGNDLDNFPTFRQRYYAIVSKFEVDVANNRDFECFMRDTLRLYQQYPGYLFSHWLRSRDRPDGVITYYLFQTWMTMGAFKKAFTSAYREDLTRLTRIRNDYVPQVLKIVADDVDYVPHTSGGYSSLDKSAQSICRQEAADILRLHHEGKLIRPHTGPGRFDEKTANV